jgi:putative SOS response-associated peptidase YedK
MCGRFNSIASGKDFASVYDAQFLTDELLPNFNVAPTTLVYVLHRQDGGRVLDAMSWGLVPSWSKDKTRAASMINARSETLTEKPSFRNLVSEHRCVLPIQGFYEWQNLPSETKKPKKQAHYISRVDERPMTLAGLWTIWKQPDSSLLRTCTIITTEANEKLSPIHHRMPVILERDSVEIWLGESKALPNDLLIAAKNEIVMSEPTSRLDRASNSSTAQLDDDSSGRLF